MRLNVQDELQRFKTWQVGAPPAAALDLFQLLSVITAYLRRLNTGDRQVTEALREIGPQLVAELDRFMPQSAPARVNGHLSANKDDVLFAIYDRIENLMIVARTNQDPIATDIYRLLLDNLQAIYAQELQWIRMNSLGQTYNPYEYDGFAVERSFGNQIDDCLGLVIVNELRAGFTYRGKVIRKPVVEFLE